MTVSLKLDIAAGVALAISRLMMLKIHESIFIGFIVSCAPQLLARGKLDEGLAAGSVNRHSFVLETSMVGCAILNGVRLTSMEAETIRNETNSMSFQR